MSNFIEQLYYGNINPQDRNAENNKTMQKKMATLIQNEDFLKNVLTGEAKQRFIAFDDVWSAVNNETNLDSFILGFRLGAHFTYDTFVSTDAPFKDFANE